MRVLNRKPSVKRRPCLAVVPTVPGTYRWTGAGYGRALVELYTKGRGKALYLLPPITNAVEIKVSNMTAGKFTLVKEKADA